METIPHGVPLHNLTDQRSLQFLLEQRILTPEQQKWMGKLVGYDYEITYKLGSVNAAADALSCHADNPLLNVIFVQTSSLWNELREVVKSDLYLLKLTQLATQSPGRPYTRRNRLLCYNNRVVLPPQSPFIKLVMHEFHDAPTGGNSGL